MLRRSSVEKPDKRMGVEDKQLEESASSVLEDGTTPVAKAPGSQLSLRETFSVWRKGVFWSVALSFAVISACIPLPVACSEVRAS